MRIRSPGVKRFSVVAVFLLGLVSVTLYNQKSLSASLTSVSATLSNSRPSFRGALTSNNIAGTSIVNINTTPAAYYSTSSAQLVEGDVVRIGEAASLGSYTVSSTPSVGQFTITSTLASGDADTGDDVISSQSGTLTVRFTTANAINSGRFRVLVPALANDGASADGIPDGSFFDFGAVSGGTPSTVTCPADVASQYDFVAGTATASAITIGGNDYHSYECAYSNVGAVGTPFDGTTQGAIVINNLINPAPAAGHTGGNADRYNVIVQHLNNSFSVSDSTTVNIGVIEAVKITATVAPQISFRIDGIASGASACGSANVDVTSTPTLVPFGDLLIGSFVEAAQTLVVSTNASNGYAVTAVANDQLGRDGGACTGDPTTDTDCIPDSRGDDAGMTHIASDDWSATATKGFAYSLHNTNSIAGITTGSAAENFNYNSTVGACGGGGDCYRQFADTEGSQSPVRIFSNTTPADNDNIAVCYKAIISTTQAAGSYESYITYTATATF